MANQTQRTSAGLVMVRITLGWLCILIGWSWTAGEGLTPKTVKSHIENHLDDVVAPLHFWADSVLLYNPDAIAFLVGWLTLLSGVCLLVGGLTRPAASFIAFLALHVALLSRPELTQIAYLTCVCALGCAISRAGRSFGLDRALDGNLPGWLTWVRSDSGFLGS